MEQGYCFILLKNCFKIITDSLKATKKHTGRSHAVFTQPVPKLTSCITVISNIKNIAKLWGQNQEIDGTGPIYRVYSDFTGYTDSSLYLRFQINPRLVESTNVELAGMEDRLYQLFCIRDLSICGSWYSWGVPEPVPADTEGWLYMHSCVYVWSFITHVLSCSYHPKPGI